MLNRASKKLTEKWIGPYEVTRVTPNAVELKLLKTLRIHPVVNVSRVKPYLGPLPGQPMSQPSLVHGSEEHDEEYEVEYIEGNSSIWHTGKAMKSMRGHGNPCQT